MERSQRSQEQRGTIEPSTGRAKKARRLGEVARRMIFKTNSEDPTNRKDGRTGKLKRVNSRGLERPGYIVIPNDMPRNAPDVKLSVDEIGKALRQSRYQERYDAVMEDMAEGDSESK